MPTFQATLDEMQELRIQCLRDPELAAIVASKLRALDDAVRGVCAAGERQETLTEQRLQATRELHAHLAKARDLRMSIRCAIIAFFGPRSEKLPLFNIWKYKDHRSAAAAERKAASCVDLP